MLSPSDIRTIKLVLALIDQDSIEDFELFGAISDYKIQLWDALSIDERERLKWLGHLYKTTLQAA